MSKHFSFVAIFQTNFVANSFVKIISPPVKIEIFSGIREYQIPIQTAFRFPANEKRKLATAETLQLRDAQYIEIKVRTQLKDADEASAFCEAKIDTTISILASVYNIHLFDLPIYKGWIIENNWGVLGGWLQTIDEPKFRINSKEIEAEISQIQRHLRKNDELYTRFSLMARFFSKAITYDLGEEKFILLWTALEVFPMKDTTNIAPISIYLGNILGKNPAWVKEQLGIGQLYRSRCALVHHGQFKINEIDSFTRDEPENERQYKYQQSDTIARLEYIVREIMRYMCGLPYSGSLDQYLTKKIT